MRRVLRDLAALLAGDDERRTNVALLILIVGAALTGALNFALGTGWAAWPTVAHGAVTLAIVVLAFAKYVIVRRGLSRRPLRATWPSLVLALLIVTAIVSGVLHATGLVLAYGPLDDMQVHVGAALLALPFAAWHVIARRTYPGRQDLTRRNLLRAWLLVGSAGAVYAGLEGIAAVAGLSGARRRFTGSFEQASHDPDRMPSIIWLFDPRLELDVADWELTVVSGATRHSLDYDDVAAFDDRVTAVIDCTSGWYAEQDWSGVALPRLLGPLPDGARSLLVRSETGYSRRFPIDDVPDLLLATGYEGRPLAPRHGFPARLVAPGRRGFWWVKWVTHLEVSDAPWWWQPPYPVQ